MSPLKWLSFLASRKTASPKAGHAERSSTNNGEMGAKCLSSKPDTSIGETDRTPTTRPGGVELTDEQISAMRNRLQIGGDSLIVDCDLGRVTLPKSWFADKSPGMPPCKLVIIEAGALWWSRSTGVDPTWLFYSDHTHWPRA